MSTPSAQPRASKRSSSGRPGPRPPGRSRAAAGSCGATRDVLALGGQLRTTTGGRRAQAPPLDQLVGDVVADGHDGARRACASTPLEHAQRRRGRAAAGRARTRCTARARRRRAVRCALPREQPARRQRVEVVRVHDVEPPEPAPGPHEEQRRGSRAEAAGRCRAARGAVRRARGELASAPTAVRRSRSVRRPRSRRVTGTPSSCDGLVADGERAGEADDLPAARCAATAARRARGSRVSSAGVSSSRRGISRACARARRAGGRSGAGSGPSPRAGSAR